jgi:hypothetical protein
LTGIYIWGSKTVIKRIPEDFFPVFSGGIFHRNVVLEGVSGIPVFYRFHRILCRNSCGTGIPVFTLDSSGFLRIPLDSSGFLFPPNSVLLLPATKVGFLLSKYQLK